MTDKETTTMGPAAHARPRPFRRFLLIALVALAAGLTGAIASQAFSGPGRGHWHAPGWGMTDGLRGLPDPGWVEDRADRMVRHLAVEIDATAEQQQKLRAIVRSAVKDLLPLREQMRAAHQRVHELFTRANVDRAAIETFRAEQMARADALTRRIAQALGDAADVLTVEQRQMINDHLVRRRGPWRGWRHD